MGVVLDEAKTARRLVKTIKAHNETLDLTTSITRI